MMTVHEVSKLAGVSIRTLQYYDCQDFLFAYIISFYKSEAPDFLHSSHMYIPE